MAEFKQYTMVRVRQLLHPAKHYDAWRLNKRPPQIGDKGVIVDIFQASGLPDNYLVECSGADGVTIWLSDFTLEELEAEQ